MSDPAGGAPACPATRAHSTTHSLLWAIAAICLLSHFYLNIWTLRGATLTDFHVYYEAVRNSIEGQTVYDLDAGMPFLYPPFFLVLLRPIGWLSEPVATSVWLYLQNALLALSLVALLAVYRRWDSVHTAFGIILFTVFSPVMLNMLYGQVNALHLALLSLFVLAYCRGGESDGRGAEWDGAAALALGTSISIRILPGGLLVMALIQRRWRMAVATVGVVAVEAFAAGAVVGFEVQQNYFTSLIFQLRGLENMREISLLAFFGQHLSPPFDWLAYGAVVAAALAIFAVFVLGPMWRNEPSASLHAAFVLTSMVMLAPLLEYHHYVVLLAPCILVLGELRRQGRCASTGTIPVFLSWAIVSAANQFSHHGYRAAAYAALAGAALLWVYTVILIRSGRPVDPPRKPLA